MKKIFITIQIILCILLLAACKTPNKENADMIQFESHKSLDIDWNETAGTYEKDVVPDKETALKIAQAVFDSMKKDEEDQKYVAQHIYYYEQDQIWAVLFWEDYNDDAIEYMVGGGCSIYIQKKDGKILRIEFGE